MMGMPGPLGKEYRRLRGEVPQAGAVKDKGVCVAREREINQSSLLCL